MKKDNKTANVGNADFNKENADENAGTNDTPEKSSTAPTVNALNNSAKTKKGGLFAIFLCWSVYTAAYLGRYSYSSNIISVINYYKVSHASAGLVTTCFFFSYGVGQLINGLLCNRYNKKVMIALSLLISSAINSAVFYGAPFVSFKYLWVLNGAAQSVLWSSLISALSQTLQGKDLSKATVIMSTTVPVGTFLTYGLSAVEAATGAFKYSFLVGAAVMIICAAVWLVFYDKNLKNDNAKPDKPEQESKPLKEKQQAAFSPYLVAMFAIIAIAVAACNLIKDGLTAWVPSILNEKFSLNESLSIVITLTLPLLGMVGAFINTVIVKKLKSYVGVFAVYFTVVSISILLVTAFSSVSMWALIILFGIISLLMYAVNNFVTSLLPLYMRDKVNAGMFAGIFNACGYVGSMISSYGLGKVADSFGWNGVFNLLLCVGVAVAAISVLYEIARKTSKKSQSDIL